MYWLIYSKLLFSNHHISVFICFNYKHVTIKIWFFCFTRNYVTPIFSGFDFIAKVIVAWDRASRVA